MYFKQILVVKETRENEKRVALTPKMVARLTQKGYRILVEESAGLNSGFTDDEYVKAGAKVFILSKSGFPAYTFIVRVLRPSKERETIEKSLYHGGTAMLGFLFPFVADNHIDTWQALELTTLSFDLFKSLSIHDPKNAQAAMSRIAGRLALHDALKHYRGKKNIILTVIGAGAAGLSAAFEGLKCGIKVQVFGRREALRKELEAAGASYYVLPETTIEQIHLIRSYLTESNIVITAARTPGKKAPLLIDEESLKILPPKAVVVDLAISNGGNVCGSKHDQIITLENDVLLVNVSGYPKTEPRASSEIYAQCVFHLLTEVMSPVGELLFENELVQEIWVTHNKQLHESLYSGFDESKVNSLKFRSKL
jgi:H+-translocating NAD(P) transhydrogenase subunit alpha